MRIGVDLGGTKIEGIALADDGLVAARRRIPTPTGHADEVIAAIASLVAALEVDAGCPGAPVGVGTPGSISKATGRLRNSNLLCLQGCALDRDLEARLGARVRVANDANCFALSEASDGAARGAEVVFGVILGTGTGGGLVVRGAPVVGRHAIAGEWGHMPLPWPEGDERPGPTCYCGRTGCVETFLSGPGLQRDFARAAGRTLDAASIVSAAEAGDREATAALARFEDRLARALAVVIDVLDPDAVVLGGGLSNIARLYDEVPRRLGAWVFSDSVTTPIVPAVHGDSSGVRGAAWLWPVDAAPDPRAHPSR